MVRQATDRSGQTLVVWCGVEGWHCWPRSNNETSPTQRDASVDRFSEQGFFSFLLSRVSVPVRCPTTASSTLLGQARLNFPSITDPRQIPPQAQLHSLIDSNAVTISKLLDLCPPGVSFASSSLDCETEPSRDSGPDTWIIYERDVQKRPVSYSQNMRPLLMQAHVLRRADRRTCNTLGPTNTSKTRPMCLLAGFKFPRHTSGCQVSHQDSSKDPHFTCRACHVCTN